MSAPVIWVFFPGLIGILLIWLRSWERTAQYLAIAISLFLAWAAWQIPIDEPLGLGPLTVKISPTLSLLGREFTLTDPERPFLVLLYLMLILWIAGAGLAKVGRLFVPLALTMVALLTAALAVEPFLYAALLIEMVVLISIPLLVPSGSSPGRGVFRFLTFQTIGMPFILFVGWMLAGVEASPGNLALVVRAGVLIGLGFAFLLAFFPFHSWVPMLVEEAHPYVVAFLLFMLTTVLSLFGIGFLDRFVWLRDSPTVYDLLRSAGVLMVLVGGVSVAFQAHLGRMLGYSVMFETGLALLAVSLGGFDGLLIYFALILPRGLAFVIWGVALGNLMALSEGGMDISTVRGLALENPALAGALLLPIFTLAGLPLLAGFPIRFALWDALAAGYPQAAFSALVGGLGLLIAGLRVLSALVSDRQEATPAETVDRSFAGETGLIAWILFALSGGVLLLIGIFPQWVLPLFSRLPGMFEQLAASGF